MNRSECCDQETSRAWLLPGAKKCKEKFENIYKYHKRTKERAARVDGKPYRFSNQLEAIDSRPSLPPLSFEIQIPNPIPISTTVLNVTPTNPADSPQANAYQSCQNIYISEFISTSLSPRSSLREKSGYTKRKWSTFFENLIEEVI
ncbi:hypothetical protein IFM89_018402 [Coptis chinensis]|uniref:Uncharacterized protein n=1 Tax=Coptis chinensis TaxID=261450 RepID=A0A835HMY6_9MAGN|nr:hypothetical protein IFM89_018402 [Coptis chinensis]